MSSKTMNEILRTLGLQRPTSLTAVTTASSLRRRPENNNTIGSSTYSLNKLLQEHKNRPKTAATKIQSMFRGHQARKRVTANQRKKRLLNLMTRAANASRQIIRKTRGLINFRKMPFNFNSMANQNMLNWERGNAVTKKKIGKKYINLYPTLTPSQQSRMEGFAQQFAIPLGKAKMMMINGIILNQHPDYFKQGYLMAPKITKNRIATEIISFASAQPSLAGLLTQFHQNAAHPNHNYYGAIITLQAALYRLGRV